MRDDGAAAPWRTPEFTERLRAVAEERHHDRHPFNLRMHQGELTGDQLCPWIANRFHHQRHIPVKDALILARFDDPALRRARLRRIQDHDGVRPALDAVAASLTELPASGPVRTRTAAFERPYPWIAADGLAYFRTRIGQGGCDGEEALAPVRAWARTREQQERAVAALAFKCDVLWALLDAVERGGTG
ncbi:pyrroloquinoline quinone biosynthesis protein C [Streptomyces sp. NPDC005474]|uniref:pyrroloquinoline quinone biosynthesis protein C n=1 Tax=Streptomyces sp. NPDC005474 TaxID=3154878 RepID=UPI003452CADC